VLGGKSVTGSIVGTRQDLAEVYALHAAGRTVVVSYWYGYDTSFAA
jgi:propanol-preferring alcohol dehydrogenase